MKTPVAVERLHNLTVADVMNRDVVTIEIDQPMSQVASIFLTQKISAAPVVDLSNRFVGIISATDFLRRDSSPDQHRLQAADETHCWEIVDPGPDIAGAYMTTAVQTVSPQASLLRAAMVMSAEHIHRLPVLDAQSRVVGVISTMDITAAVVHIVDELNADLMKESSVSRS